MAEITIAEAALKQLEKFGITAEMLKESKTKEIGDAAAKYFEALTKEKIKNEVLQETKDENDAAVEEAKKTAQIGAYNAAKNKIAKLAKKLGLEIPKDELERNDFDKTLSLLEGNIAIKKDDGNDGKDSTAAELAQLREQLEKANEMITNYKAEVEAFPTKLESHAKKVQSEIKVSQMREQLFESFKGKVQPYIFENAATKRAIAREIDEFLKEKGIVFDIVTGTDGKEILLPKQQQIGKDGKPMLDKNGAPVYIPAAKDATSNYDATGLLETYFQANNLIALQHPATTQPISTTQPINNTQNPKASEQWKNVPIGK